MDTKNFLTRIFAQTDEVVICTHRPDPSGRDPRGIFWNRGSFADIDDAVNAIQTWDAEPNSTIYYTVGAFANHAYMDGSKTKWTRKQADATWFKALALDLDIGADKPYATQSEGWKAMSKALGDIGMPGPMVVSSGNGIHCYWPLTAAITKAEWVETSIALRLALEEHGVQIDTSKIHDPSMVLRPVGTHHKKQIPFKVVECKRDCPDYEHDTLKGVLSKWVGMAVTKAAKASGPRKKSSIMDAVLNTNDVRISEVGKRCNQIGKLIDSGGVLDAAGRPVDEPLWRASLGMAKHATDVQEAVIMLAGKHHEFDLDKSLEKIDGWNGTGPTTCLKFEQLCAVGCDGCPYRGKLTSPAQLSVVTETEIVDEEGVAKEYVLPKNYVMQNGQIYLEKKTEVTTTDANGNNVAQEVIEHELVSQYEMHITGVYHDPASSRSAFKLIVKYPMSGWIEQEHEMPVLASTGKDFSTFLLNRQIYIKHLGAQEKLRSYLMDYLTMVQQQSPTGLDFTSFGWQKDGSFLCGDVLLGSNTTDMRLRGNAAKYGQLLGRAGTRENWVAGMKLLNHPGSENIRACTLIAAGGLIAFAGGNSTGVVSIYSTESSTGKSLSLIAVNSLIGKPKALFLAKNDTQNALYNIRGMYNHLPACIDEVTTSKDEDMVDMTYTLSQGREKISMNKDRSLREPVTWPSPTFMSTNISIHQKYEYAQAGNEPLKARCLELPQHDRAFVKAEDENGLVARQFYDLVMENHGWAMPELAEIIIDKGGPVEVWKWAEASFDKTFGFEFEPQERFHRTNLIAAWGMGRIGEALGLFPFDVKGTIKFLISRVERERKNSADNRIDVFDIVGQFLSEHNDQLVQCREKYGSGVEQVTMPAPERAVARIKITHDDTNDVMPGSMVAINRERLRLWLKQRHDSMDRIERELEDANALIHKSERITMFKGCPKTAPGQAKAIVLSLNHPRFADTVTSKKAQSKIALAVLQGNTAA